MIDTKNSLFLLVDVQEKLFPHIHNRDELSKNLPILISGLKLLEVPIIVCEQYKKGLGETISPIKELVSDQPFFEKTEFSAMKNSLISETIKKSGKKVAIVAGTESHICVLQTCLDLADQGYEVIFVADCCGTRKSSDHTHAITRLSQLGVLISSYESILFELTQDSKHPKFREISQLIR